MDKEEVKILLGKARENLKRATLFPQGMSVTVFHDIKEMIEVLNEILKEMA